MDHRLVLIGKYEKLASLNIVYIHGLTGNVYETWNGNELEVNKSENDNFEKAPLDKVGKEYWPLKLKKAYSVSDKRANVWSLGYPAPLTKKNDPYKYVESLRTASSNIIDKLVIPELTDHNSGGIVFIAHSLGGIMVKTILSQCKKDNDKFRQRLYQNVCGVAFLGTPNYGSGLANVFDFVTEKASSNLNAILRFFVKDYLEPSNAVQWLKKNNPELRDLANEFRSIVVEKDIEVKVYYETSPYKGLLRVVDEANADPGIPNCNPKPIPNCNHSEIAKPTENKGNILHLDVLNWLNKIYTNLERGKSIPVLKENLEIIIRNIAKSIDGLEDIDPRNLHPRIESIPAKHRSDLSHKFRSEAIELSKSLNKSLMNNEFITKLKYSKFDFDKLVLFQLLSNQLEIIIDQYEYCLNNRNSQINRESNPSLIITWELIRSIWNVLSKDSVKLKHEMESYLSWLKRAKSNSKSNNFEIDITNESEKFVEDSIEIMKILDNWPKP